jgi:hypothetical protein
MRHQQCGDQEASDRRTARALKSNEGQRDPGAFVGETDEYPRDGVVDDSAGHVLVLSMAVWRWSPVEQVTEICEFVALGVTGQGGDFREMRVVHNAGCALRLVAGLR